MRFKIKLATVKKNHDQLLPINYQYGLSSFIYNTINHGNADLAGYKFELISEKPKSKLITIKAGTREESKIRGFLYNFRLTAPLPLVKTAYYAGLGKKNSMGMGCLVVN